MKKSEIFRKKRRFSQFFVVRVAVGPFSSERAQKELKNEVLDAKKFDDTAENEAFEVLKLRVYSAARDVKRKTGTSLARV